MIAACENHATQQSRCGQRRKALLVNTMGGANTAPEPGGNFPAQVMAESFYKARNDLQASGRHLRAEKGVRNHPGGATEPE